MAITVYDFYDSESQACTHIGALLFLLADVQAQGDTTFPQKTGATEELCNWNKPKGHNHCYFSVIGDWLML